MKCNIVFVFIFAMTMLLSAVISFAGKRSGMTFPYKPLRSRYLNSFPNNKISPQLRQHKPSIILTKEEVELFRILRSVGEWGKVKTTVRVAGGWIRDKLLGIEGKRGEHSASCFLLCW